MSLLLRLSVLFPVFALMTVAADEAPSQVVVAIRYLKKEGVSHSHLDLFDGSGRFLRRLTNDDSGQDFDPVFSPKGRSVVYRRMTEAGTEWRMVSIDGKSDEALASPPEWYAEASKEPEKFDYPPSVRQPSGTETGITAAKPGDLEYKAASGQFALTLKDARVAGGSGDAEYFPKQSFLRSQGANGEVMVETLPVFAPARTAGENHFWSGPLPSGKVSHEREANEGQDVFGACEDTPLMLRGTSFLEQGALQVAFFIQHRGSTRGEGLFALDLKARRLFELSPNGGKVVPLPGIPWFAVMCDQLYLPFFDHKSVNGSYLDLWDAKMQQIRFGEPKPAICYGASILIGDKDVRVVSLSGMTP